MIILEEESVKLIFKDIRKAYNPLEKENPDTVLSIEERAIGETWNFYGQEYGVRYFLRKYRRTEYINGNICSIIIRSNRINIYDSTGEHHINTKILGGTNYDY